VGPVLSEEAGGEFVLANSPDFTFSNRPDSVIAGKMFGGVTANGDLLQNSESPVGLEPTLCHFCLD
jgi:hypothetical protein